MFSSISAGGSCTHPSQGGAAPSCAYTSRQDAQYAGLSDISHR